MISNMILKENVFTIYNKTKMDQEFKSEGQGHKISIFKNGGKQAF